jgi:2-dehydro-3-deoxyglucarate aldolase/4-hydroxy-2-oxoheptanedioate aldolase
MPPNPVKAKLRAGETVLGTFLFEFNSPGVMRIAAVAGAEFVLCDMEHSGWSIETIRRLIASAPLPDSRPPECSPLAERADADAGSATRPHCVPLVRVPATEYHFIARVLDVGAMGIMVPMVESRAQAEKIVSSAKYPPVGRRGAAFTMPHDGYLPGRLQDKIAEANREVLLIAQIETRAGLDNVEEIAAVDGIDALWIGQTDLTCSLGIPGEFDHPQFHAAVDRVLEACRAHGKTAAYMPLSIEEGGRFLQRGFRLMAYSGDLWIYQQGLRQGLRALRDAAKPV